MHRLSFWLAILIVVLVLQEAGAIKIRNQFPESFLDETDQCVSKEESTTYRENGRRFLAKKCNLDGEASASIRVLIELFGIPHLITTEEVTALGESITQTYNDLIACDGQFYRKIVKSQLITDVSNFQDLGEQDFKLEYEFTLLCRGCDKSLLLKYDFDGEEIDCPCKAPSNDLFYNEVGRRMEILLRNRSAFPNVFEIFDGAELKSLANCQPSQNFISSDVVVEFFGCPIDLPDSTFEEMADSFLQSYNNLNRLNSYRCDPNFREITSIKPFFDRSDYDIDFNKRRRLDDTDYYYYPDDGIDFVDDEYVFECPFFYEVRFEINATCRGCNINTTSLFDEYEEENFYEYDDDQINNDNGEAGAEDEDDSGDYDDEGEADEDDEDGSESDNNGNGNGEAGAGAEDEDDSGNYYDEGEADEDDEPNDGDGEGRVRGRERHLRNMPFRKSGCKRGLQINDCQCPISPTYRAVTEEEMIEFYDSSVTRIPGVGEIVDVIEIEKVECDPNVNNFTTKVVVSFGTNSDSETASDELANTLSQTFKRSFNDLIQRYRDPNFRSVAKIAVPKKVVTPSRRYLELETMARTNSSSGSLSIGFNFTFVLSFHFFISGFCRGCPGGRGNFFLFPDAFRRNLKTKHPPRIPKAASNNKFRRLQDGDECFYAAVNYNQGAPSEREFSERFDADVQALSNRGSLANQYKVVSLTEKYDGPKETVPGQCSEDSECGNNKDFPTLCVSSRCLNEGRPRITLTWVGNDDIDLRVTTPQGKTVNYTEYFDPISGGTFDTSFAQTANGSHVESIFFPLSGRAPGGLYEIDVVGFQERGEADLWTLEVFDNGLLAPVFREQGTGKRLGIPYLRSDGDEVLQAVCSREAPFTECCEDEECTEAAFSENEAKRCDNRQCISIGNHSFTLTSFGNDVISLNVVTPSGDKIYFGNPIDEKTGGVFESDKNINVTGNTWHTQNVYFPPLAPPGTYLAFVEPIEQRGEVSDAWIATALNNGEVASRVADSGYSDRLSVNIFECIENKDCDSTLDETCVNNHCITGAANKIRFTLTWGGNDDIYISIKTPLGTNVSWEHPVDEESGGELFNPYLYDKRRLKYVLFDVKEDVSVANYTITVENLSRKQGKTADSWNLTVHVDGKQEESWLKSELQTTLTWVYNKETPPLTFCFSGATSVITEDRGVISMRELKLGDKILTSSDSLTKFEPVYSFGHRSHSLGAEFLQILPSKLEITRDHMIFIAEKDQRSAVPASLLQVGDRLSDGTVVEAIKTVKRQGVYAPFTPSGILLVNNVSVSSYVAFQDSQYFMTTGISYQRLAHTYTFPRRFWCTRAFTQVNVCLHEDYTETGTSVWVDLSHKIARKWMNAAENNAIVFVLGTLSIMVFFIPVACLDISLHNAYYRCFFISLLIFLFAFAKVSNPNRKPRKTIILNWRCNQVT